MKSGPDIARIAALVGDPARANMLTAMLTGTALTASELALEAGVTPATTSSHLARLLEGDLIAIEKQGRHRYYRLAGPEVATMLEGLMGLAAGRGHMRSRPGPRDPALRRARVCYDHLAGDYGVQLYENLTGRGLIRARADGIALTEAGAAAMTGFGIDLAGLQRKRRPLYLSCLDWSVRRSHLAGGLGAALLEAMLSRGWAERCGRGRVIAFSPKGEVEFAATFGTPDDLDALKIPR